MKTATPKNIDEYISFQPPDKQELLKKVREAIKSAAPDAVECISYTMPSYKFNGKPVVYFALNKNHIGFYATPSANIAFREELRGYKSSKGAVQFPFDRPVPYELIRKMVLFKMNEILSESPAKKP